MRSNDNPLVEGDERVIASTAKFRRFLKKRWRLILGCLVLVFVARLIVGILIAEPVEKVSVVFKSSEPANLPKGFPNVEKLIVTATNEEDTMVYFQLATVETNSGGTWVRDAGTVNPGDYMLLFGIGGNTTGDFEIHLPETTSRRRLTLLAREDHDVSILLAIPQKLLGQEIVFAVSMGMHDLLYPPKKLIVETGSASNGP